MKFKLKIKLKLNSLRLHENKISSLKWTFWNSPASGHVTTVPKVPPNSADINLPRSDGGAHLEIKLCNAGYKTPCKSNRSFNFLNLIEYSEFYIKTKKTFFFHLDIHFSIESLLLKDLSLFIC